MAPFALLASLAQTRGQALTVTAADLHGGFMQFLAVIGSAPGAVPPPNMAELVSAERDRARTLYAQGQLRQIWTRGDEPGTCVIVEAIDESAARAMLVDFPLTRAGVTVIHTFVALMPFAGFGPAQA